MDLRKVSLLDAFLKLPHEILIPNTLFELLKFTEAQKRRMLRGGLKVIDLPGGRVLRTQQVMTGVPPLSVHDGLAFALAEALQGCIQCRTLNPLQQHSADLSATDMFPRLRSRS